jgi:uncharacterized coiled-coil DUF342 family protein
VKNFTKKISVPKHETLFSQTIQYLHHDSENSSFEVRTHHRLNILRTIFNLLSIRSSKIATTIKRLKNTIADYDNQLIKTSEILQTFETKLDTIEYILESRTLKANQLRDEIFDKPAELEELRATSEGFQDMHDQVVSFIRYFIDKIKPKQELNE